MAERRALRGPYTGPACPRCAMALDASVLAPGEQSCPSCSRSFHATPFAPPEPRAEVVASIVEAGPAGGVACGRHAGNAAVANCSRCGVFMCSLCRIAIDGMELCPACFDRLSSEGALAGAQTRIRDYRGLAITFGVFGCLVYVFGLITGPLTFYFVWKGFRQRRELGDSGGVLSLLFAALLGLLQIGVTVTVIFALVAGLSR
jgi:hypothetical protein